MHCQVNFEVAMCKAVDRGMVMTNVRVLEKHGGQEQGLDDAGVSP